MCTHTRLARPASWFAAPLVVAAATLAGAVESVRVDVAGGAPRIVVDGKPVRARMFWGGPGAGGVNVGPDGGTVRFEFTALEDEPAGATMHFRFGKGAGEILLDDLRVEPVAGAPGAGRRVVLADDFEAGQPAFDRSWLTWPTGPANTTGAVRVEPGAGRDRTVGLRVTLKAPPDGKWPDWHIHHRANLALRRGARYAVTFWARAVPARRVQVAFYRPGTTYTFLGGPDNGFESQVRMAGAAGAPFVSFPIGFPWPKAGVPVDWASVDATIQRVLDINPDTLLIPRVPIGAPRWWLEAHPDDAMAWDRPPREQGGYVVSSPAFRKEAAERLAAFVEHVEAKFGASVAGYHPCGQNTGEWFYLDTWGPGLNGYARGDERDFRAWLGARYPDDAALRAAWGDPAVTRATATVPSSAARRAAPAGALRDPVAERPILDFTAFQQDAMAGLVCDLARAVRTASRGKKLVVFFYGYAFEFAAVQNGPATSGHYAMRRVLQSPDIDVLCSPISYFDRGVGQGAPAMTAAESVALAGKMWLYEDDTYTHIATGTPPGWKDAARTPEQTHHELLRNTAQCALRNFGTWWMDLGMTGWFNERGMWDQMVRLRALDDALLASPRPFTPQVAAVIDEKAMQRVAFGGRDVTNPGVYEARRALGRMGAPYGQYYQDDVLAGRVKAPLYVFLTAWRLDPAERRALLDATRGSTRLWCYAPGFHEEARTTLDGMRDLTGFTMKRLSKTPAWVEPTGAGRKLGLATAFGVKKPIEPLFAAADAKPEETLATYPDGSAAVALRPTPDGGASLFVGPPALTSELLRLAARRAGVHLYTTTDCNVYANAPYLVLHAAADGEVEVDVGRPGGVRDLLTNTPAGTGPRLKLPLKKGETRLLRLADDPK